EAAGARGPQAGVPRMHLKGLPSFRASSGKITLNVAVSIQEGKTQVRIWKDGKEDAPLDEKSPFWTDIRVVGGDGKPARVLPLKDGYFEVALPRALFEGNPESVTLHWVNLYRQGIAGTGGSPFPSPTVRSAPGQGRPWHPRPSCLRGRWAGSAR